jgi:ATP-dependent Lon protease
MWGRISDSFMRAKCMNPVMYFDELDKISGTPHGEEIASMLIHLTDRSQNTQFHDRYFAGIDFDVSQCLFVFSFNDINLVNPILRDRMQVIHCAGYTAKEKQSILQDYVWPDLLQRLNFNKEDVILTDEASKFIISEYSAKEEGVRTLIRTTEALITRLNMLRIADEETMKDYKFYTKVEFPLRLNETVIKVLLVDTVTKEAEPWRTMYT